MVDTSNYAHCRTLLAKIKRMHIRRLVVLAVLLILNFYVHALAFGVKYAGPAMEVAVSMGGTGVSMLPFGMGMATLICSIITIVLGIFAEAKRPKLTFILMGLVLACAFADFYNKILAVIILVMYGLAIKEIMNYRWLKEQPGFPMFSERFDEQQENSEYKPLYKMDGKSQGVMTELSEDESDPFMLQRSAEMPGIPEIPDTFSEPEASPLPDPVQTQPSFPDPVTDTSSILSDPMSDFPDLPDVPDIPKL